MKKHKLQDSHIQKVTDNKYFSKIRSRKIEKCLLQLQETLTKNETSGSATRSIDMPMLIETSNMHKIFPKKCTQSHAGRICETNMQVGNSQNFNWTNAYAHDLEQQQNDENIAKFADNMHSYYGKISDPSLCMLLMQSGWNDANYFNDVSAKNSYGDQRMDYLLQNSMPTIHDNAEMLKIEYLQRHDDGSISLNDFKNMDNIQSNNVYLHGNMTNAVTEERMDLKHFMPFNEQIINSNAEHELNDAENQYHNHNAYAIKPSNYMAQNLYTEYFQHDQ